MEMTRSTPVMIWTLKNDEDDSVRQSTINFFTGNEDEKCLLNQLPAKAKKEQKMATKTKTTKATKVTKKAVTKKVRDDSKPMGMTAELVKLALRASGVTPAQLNEHSQWKGAPRKWFFSNPKKTGVADRFGMKLKVERDGRAVTYFLTAK
jgi:hypothetical protein